MVNFNFNKKVIFVLIALVLLIGVCFWLFWYSKEKDCTRFLLNNGKTAGCGYREVFVLDRKDIFPGGLKYLTGRIVQVDKDKDNYYIKIYTGRKGIKNNYIKVKIGGIKGNEKAVQLLVVNTVKMLSISKENHVSKIDMTPKEMYELLSSRKMIGKEAVFSVITDRESIDYGYYGRLSDIRFFQKDVEN